MFDFARWRGLAAARQVNAGVDPAAFRRAYPRLEPTPRPEFGHEFGRHPPYGAHRYSQLARDRLVGVALRQQPQEGGVLARQVLPDAGLRYAERGGVPPHLLEQRVHGRHGPWTAQQRNASSGDVGVKRNDGDGPVEDDQAQRKHGDGTDLPAQDGEPPRVADGRRVIADAVEVDGPYVDGPAEQLLVQRLAGLQCLRGLGTAGRERENLVLRLVRELLQLITDGVDAEELLGIRLRPGRASARLLGDDHGQSGAALLKLSLPAQQFCLLQRERRVKADLRGNRPEDTGILCAWLQQGDHGQLVQGLLDHRLGDADPFAHRRSPRARIPNL